MAATVALVVGALLLSWLSSTGRRGYLDAEAYDPAGARAVVQVVRGAGVTVDQVRTLDDAVAAAPGATLVVTQPDLLAGADAARLADAGAATLLVVAPHRDDVLAELGAGTTFVRGVDDRVIDAACDLRAAALARSARTGGATYRVEPSAAVREVAACYPVGGDPSVVVVTHDAGRTVVLGTPRPLQNGWLDEQGNAALAVNLLGAHDRVVWYLPRLDDLLAGEQEPDPLLDLLPDAAVWAVIWLGVVVVLAAAWRARRLGPLVVEELPVVVRASETTEGRARLYRRARARDHAALLLRAATLDRLLPLLGLGTGAPPTTVVPLVAARTSWTDVDVATLLYGAAPRDDAALVRLADDLDRLEREVRRP